MNNNGIFIHESNERISITEGTQGSITAGLNMSDWTVAWNGIIAIPMCSRIQDYGTSTDEVDYNFLVNDITGNSTTARALRASRGAPM